MYRKLLIPLAVIGGLLLLLTGCARIGGNSSLNAVQGTGEMVSRPFDVGDFNSINVGGSFVIVYRHSNEMAVTVAMQENLFEYLDVNTNGGQLVVGFSRGISVTSGNNPRLYVYAPYLVAADFSGAIDATGWDKIEVESFEVNASGAANIDMTVAATNMTIEVSGAADIDLELNVAELEINASGAGNLTLVGAADTINIRGSGSIGLFGGNLQVGSGYVNVSGAAEIVLSSLDNVDINVSGAARVRAAE